MRLLPIIFIVFVCLPVHAEVVKIPYKDYDGSMTTVEAVLTLPTDKKLLKYPAILIAHTRGGWGTGVTTQYAKLFSERGAVALELRMFNTKPDNPLRYVSQAFAALDYLARRDDVDGTKVSVMGMSYGGSLSIYVATKWAIDQFGAGKSFYKHAALYPTCFFHEGIIRRNQKINSRMTSFGFPEDFHDKWGAAPILIFAGADDTWDNDPKSCANFVSSIPNQDAQMSFRVVVWPGVHHGWDQPGTVTFFDPLACRFSGCHTTMAFNEDASNKTKAQLVEYFELK